MSSGDTFSSVAAETYDRHIGRYSPALARSLMDAAGVVAGLRALDVGCGPGPLTAELVSVLGASAVSAVDPSPPFAEACRARNPGVVVELAPAESLPFPDASVDIALAQLVVNFMTDADAGVGEMRRVVRPGGTVAAAVWDYGGEMTLLRAFWDAAVALDPAAPDEQGMRFATPETLAELWSRVGLTEVTTGAAVVSADYAGFDDLWAPFAAGVGPAGAYAVSLSPAERETLRTAFRERLGVGDEPFSLSARAWIATGVTG